VARPVKFTVKDKTKIFSFGRRRNRIIPYKNLGAIVKTEIKGNTTGPVTIVV